MLTDAQAAVERKKFFEKFEAEHNDKVEGAELATINATNTALRELNLHIQAGKVQLLGIVLFCKESIWFYVPESENYFSALVRKASHTEEEKPQSVCISALPSLKWALPRKTFFSFLSYEHKHTVCLIFSAKEGKTMYFDVIINQ